MYGQAYLDWLEQSRVDRLVESFLAGLDAEDRGRVEHHFARRRAEDRHQRQSDLLDPAILHGLRAAQQPASISDCRFYAPPHGGHLPSLFGGFGL